MTLVIIGIIVWFLAIVLILRFFTVAKCPKVKRKKELPVFQKQLLNIMSGRDQNQDISELPESNNIFDRNLYENLDPWEQMQYMDDLAELSDKVTQKEKDKKENE